MKNKIYTQYILTNFSQIIGSTKSMEIGESFIESDSMKITKYPLDVIMIRALKESPNSTELEVINNKFKHNVIIRNYMYKLHDDISNNQLKTELETCKFIETNLNILHGCLTVLLTNTNYRYLLNYSGNDSHDSTQHKYFFEQCLMKTLQHLFINNLCLHHLDLHEITSINNVTHTDQLALLRRIKSIIGLIQNNDIDGNLLSHDFISCINEVSRLISKIELELKDVFAPSIYNMRIDISKYIKNINNTEFMAENEHNILYYLSTFESFNRQELFDILGVVLASKFIKFRYLYKAK